MDIEKYLSNIGEVQMVRQVKGGQLAHVGTVEHAWQATHSLNQSSEQVINQGIS